MSYVIKRKEDGAYHCEPSKARGSCYTFNLKLAKRFSTRELAEMECCGNEYAVSTDSELQPTN